MATPMRRREPVARRFAGAARRTARNRFAVIVHDADAPIPGGFYHWVVYNLAGDANRLAANVKLAADQLGVTPAREARSITVRARRPGRRTITPSPYTRSTSRASTATRP